MTTAEPVLRVEGLRTALALPGGAVNVVDGISFTVDTGETVGLVGESGCGKSMTALSIMGLLPQSIGRITEGRVLLRGHGDLAALAPTALRRLRGNAVSMVFQEPMTSLNPVYAIGEQISEAVRAHRDLSRSEAWKAAVDALRLVGIPSPEARASVYPHQLSGGMRQRVMIAMAMVCRPTLLLADEPTTALDVTIQAQILDLLRKLQNDTGMAMMLITHDLGVVAENADTVAVMYASRVVEYATVEDLFDRPKHPYTEGLFRSIPKLGAGLDRLDTIRGTVPNPANFPAGCKFHPRCARMNDDPTCATVEPALREVGSAHWSACHHAEGFNASPVTPPDLMHKRQVTLDVLDPASATRGDPS